MRTFVIFFVAASAWSFAQDVVVQGNSAQTDVFSAKNTSTATSDRIGIHGVSTPAPNWGIGVKGEASYIGVFGDASTQGNGARYGGSFSASGGDVNYAVFGNAPSGPNDYAGYFSGNVYVSGTVTQSSDVALKKNVSDIGSPMNKLARLRPKTYELRSGEIPDIGLPSGKKYGFIAQEIEAVYPELVSNVSVVSGKHDKGAPAKSYKAVDYIGLIPILVGSIQAQQAEIETLKAEIQALKK